MPVRPRVFVPQEPMRKREGRWVSKGLNLASMVEFGERIIIWGPEASVLNREVLEREALLAAEQYDDEEDYIVALGSPTLIAILGWAIGERGKELRMLEWDTGMKRYYPTLGSELNLERENVNGNR